VEAGFKEIVLTGVHLGAYGKETARFNLASLLRNLAGVRGLLRLRLSSIEPVDISSEVFDSLSGLPAFCEHLHISLQSGSEETLRNMNRPYSPDDFLKIIERARELFPGIGISTDVIVGFPGETDEQFSESLEFVKKARFSRLHVFKYSARPGTAAASMPGRVKPTIMAERSARMIELGSTLATEFHQSFLGKRLEVLVEEPDAKGRLVGFSRNYIRAEFSGAPELENEIVNVVVRTAGPHGVISSLG
jgi:threonylcarbamoyladenosine tRNA methylthiotransferase MtaB